MLTMNYITKILKNNVKCGARYYSTQVKPKKGTNKMFAWQVHSYKEDVQLTSARIPIIREPSEVLIKVEAASVNPIDVAMRGDEYV